MMDADGRQRYSAIIDMEHHRSAKHAPMASADRAAQFAPFAALTGFDDQVRDTARLTEERIEPDEDAAEKINGVLAYICEHPNERVIITYFVPDQTKDGGAYVTRECIVRHTDTATRLLMLRGGGAVRIDDIVFMERAASLPNIGGDAVVSGI